MASKTANADRLMKEIEARAAVEGGCRFTVLIPDASDREKANRTLAWVLPLMRQATRGPVTGLVDGPDPFESVQRAVQHGRFDEIIASTLPRRASKWLRRDLITQLEGWAFRSPRWFPKWSETRPPESEDGQDEHRPPPATSAVAHRLHATPPSSIKAVRPLR